MAKVDAYETSRGEPRFRVRWWVTDRDARTRKSLVFMSEAEAETFARVIEVAGGDETKATLSIAATRRGETTVSDAVLDHIDKLLSASVEQKARYRRQVANHMSGAIGQMPVSTVKTDDVIAWVSMLQGKGLAAKTIRNVHGLLSSAMKTQVRKGAIGSSPCDGIKLPKSVSAGDTMNFLSRDEFELLLSKIAEPYQLLVETMVATGLRWGEITALTVADCDLSAAPPTVRVNKAWKRDDSNQFYVGPTKTFRGRRTVSLPTQLAVKIKESLSGKSRDSLVFVNKEGGRVRHNTFWWKTWRPAIEKAQNPVDPDGNLDLAAKHLVKTPRIHDLRHTHASWMIAQGTDLMVLQRRLGHESITTTVDRYSHLLPQQHIDAAAAAERALYGIAS